MDRHQAAGADVLQLMPRWKRPETPLAGDRQVFRPPSWIGRARDLGSLPPARHTIGSRIEVPRGDFRTRIFKIQPRVGRAKSRTWGGTRQNRRARRPKRRAAPRILPPDGVRLAGGSPEAGGTDLAPSDSFLFRWD